MRRDILSRVAREFDDDLRRLAHKKLNNGTAMLNDRESFSKRRMTLAMCRHPDMKKIMKDIELAEWEGDKPSRR